MTHPSTHSAAHVGRRRCRLRSRSPAAPSQGTGTRWGSTGWRCHRPAGLLHPQGSTTRLGKAWCTLTAPTGCPTCQQGMGYRPPGPHRCNRRGGQHNRGRQGGTHSHSCKPSLPLHTHTLSPLTHTRAENTRAQASRLSSTQSKLRFSTTGTVPRAYLYFPGAQARLVPLPPVPEGHSYPGGQGCAVPDGDSPGQHNGTTGTHTKNW